MRIAIVHYGEDSPADAGYVAGRYGALAEELHRRGHDVHRILPSMSHRIRAQRRGDSEVHSSEGVAHVVRTSSYRSARSLRRIWFLRSFARAAAKLIIDSDSFDVVLCGFPPPSTVRAVAVAAHSAGCARVLADIRDVWPDAQLSTTRGLQHRILQATAGLARMRARSALDSVDTVTAISATYLTWARATGTRTHVAETPVPIGCPPVTQAGVSRRLPDAIFVGSLSEHFDFDSLLSGWRLLTSRDRKSGAPNNARLLIVGDGPQMSHLRSRLEAEGITQLELCGRQNPNVCRKMMEASSVGVAPYAPQATMSLPNKPFEYFSAGLPVVASLGGELQDLMEAERVGFSNPSPTPEWWADRLAGLLRQTVQREEMAHRACELAAGRLSRAANMRAFADLVEGQAL